MKFTFIASMKSNLSRSKDDVWDQFDISYSPLNDALITTLEADMNTGYYSFKRWRLLCSTYKSHFPLFSFLCIILS